MNPPNYKELLFILVLGALQPVIEIAAGAQVASYYNFLAAILVLGYVIYRLVRTPSLLRAWGLRLDNISNAWRAYAAFTVAASLGIYAYGTYLGHTPLPASFWYLLVLYPIWGLAQQFALQNFIAGNLTGLIPAPVLRAIATAVIFSLAHVPSLELMVLAGVAGFFFTLLYHYFPNLILLGISHGLLGALIFYLILGQDQWAILQEYVR